jgi:hypothetical protein
MSIRNITLAIFTTLLAAGSVACSRAPDTEPRPVAEEAQEITEPSHETVGDHVVHYSAQLTTRLTAEVARATGIDRDGSRGMLNVTVLLPGDAEDRRPVSADVEVQATNLTGQLQSISMREVRDGESIYYVGDFSVANEETLTFDVTVRPEGVETTHEFSFRQQFYTD